jgi:hypothetical protein
MYALHQTYGIEWVLREEVAPRYLESGLMSDRVRRGLVVAREG